MISKVLLDSSLGPFWNDLLEVLPWSDLREWIIFVFLEKKNISCQALQVFREITMPWSNWSEKSWWKYSL